MNLRNELRKGADLKFLCVLLAAFLFTLLISAFYSYEYSHDAEELRLIRIEEAEGLRMSAEENRSLYEDPPEEELAQLMEEEVSCWESIKAGYESADMLQVLKNKIRISEIELQMKKLGVKLGAAHERELTDELELNKILIGKNLIPHDPLLEAHDGVSSMLFVLKNFMLFLLPIAVMLISTDCVSSETGSGSIKLLLMFPRSRFSILAAKYCSVVILSALTIVGSLIGSFLGGSLFSGTGSFLYPMKAQESFFTGGKEIYVDSWVVLLRAGAVLFCAVLFFAALALLISVLFRNSIVPLAVSTIGSVGIVFLNRKIVIANKGGFFRFLPFDISDSYAVSVGKITFPIKEKITTSSGLIASQDTGRFLEIINSFPGVLAIVILLISALVCFVFAVILFMKRDVA